MASGTGSETVVAAASRWPIRFLLFLMLLGPALGLLPNASIIAGSLFVALVVLAVAVDSRVGAMRLAVNDRTVQVVNFLSSHEFSLDAVVIDTEEEASDWPTDDLPVTRAQGEEAPRIGSLYLSDDTGRRVRVGVAPSYGDRAWTIANDLKIAIARHRL